MSPPIGNLSQDCKDSLSHELQKFMSSDLLAYTFPSSLTSEERKYLHLKSAELGLKSKSHGKPGENRSITIYMDKKKVNSKACSIEVSSVSNELMKKICHSMPISKEMYDELLPNPMKPYRRMAVANCKRNLPLMCDKYMSVPHLAADEDLLTMRKSLPIWTKKAQITNAIENNSVVIITAETGSGKTTQIPQFIIDDCAVKKRPCRVICCQPRRIAAISMADRVSHERGESIGMSTGYQVRLESCVSNESTIIYCTTGVLTRTLMDRHQKDNEPNKGMLMNVSHVIVDEVHERDKHVDFLLIALRMILPKYKHLKLILMSATADIHLFSSYFENCPVLKVEGKIFPVQNYFLEDILNTIKYESPSMTRIKNKTKIDYWDNDIVEKTTEAVQNMKFTDTTTTLRPDQEWLKSELDDCMHQIWFNAEIEQIDRMIYYIISEGIPVDYQHSDTGVTLLMLVAVHGLNDYVISLLNMGANPNIKTRVFDMDAATWATEFKQFDTRDLIINSKDILASKDNQKNEISDELEIKERLELYKKSLPPNIIIDAYLIAHLIKHILLKTKDGSILVFLPGFEDMSMVNKVIIEEIITKDNLKITIYMLHSMMQTSDQRRVFQPAPKGYQKVILATNIVETSVTINDVVYVIDSGRVKQKGYNAFNGISCMNINWISQSCAKQRAGRAGRLCAGECYRLYTKEHHNHMATHDVPEILRMPLQELCMLAKVISNNMRVLDFLALAIQPPPTLSVTSALEYLKTIEAMDVNEDLTDLGFFMLDLSIEPHYAKSLVFAVFLKCLDPVLTIISCLANREPFNLTLNVNMKTSLGSIRKKLAGDSLSDHIVLLRLYQVFNEGNMADDLFNFVSQSIMGLITQTRTQLLGQLRALELIQSRTGPNDIRDVNMNSNNWAAVKACLLAGLYPNLAKLDKSNPRPILKTKTEKSVIYHGSSVLRESYVKDLPSEWIIFEEMSSFNTKKFIKNCTVVSPISVALFSNAMRLPQDPINKLKDDIDCDDFEENDTLAEENLGILNLDGWTSFVGSTDDISKIINMRLCLTLAYREFLKNKMISPHSSLSSIVESVVKVLTVEDHAIGLEAPDNVGKRPKENNNKGRYSKNDNSSFSFRKYSYGQHSHNRNYTDNSSNSRTSRNSFNVPSFRGTSSHRQHQNNYSTPSTSQINNNYKWQ